LLDPSLSSFDPKQAFPLGPSNGSNAQIADIRGPPDERAKSTRSTHSRVRLVVGEVKVPTNDVEIPAYRAMPDHREPFATVLAAHEIFGVHEHIKDICRRLACLGYWLLRDLP
jgi:hypothetical protein